MAIGKPVLLWVNAQLPLPKGQHSKLQKCFRVASIHFTVGGSSSLGEEERQRLFQCGGFIVVIMIIRTTHICLVSSIVYESRITV